jgi:kumamolisin
MHRVLGIAMSVALLAGSAWADGTTLLTHDVVRHLGNATLLGPVDPAQTITVGVYLDNPNQAAEDAYLAQLNDPTSANYEQYLEPDEFAAQFAVPVANRQAAEAWLAGGGLTVTEVEGATNYILAQGPAAKVTALFNTPINRYLAAGKNFRANTQAPSVPSSLGISRVLGLNDFNRFYPPHISATDTPKWTTAPPGTAIPQSGLLHPRDLWTIYDQPPSNLGDIPACLERAEVKVGTHPADWPADAARIAAQ